MAVNNLPKVRLVDVHYQSAFQGALMTCLLEITFNM